MYKIRPVLRHAISLPWVYGPILGIAVGLASYFGTYRWLDINHVRPRAAQVEFNNQMGDIFAEIAYKYYDPANSSPTNVRFYKNLPDEALNRVRETRQLVDSHREVLTKSGHISRLPEDNLRTAEKRIQDFRGGFPTQNVEWWGYLYWGDTRRPPLTYAPELQSFYEVAEKTRKELKSTPTGRAFRDSMSVLSGLFMTIMTWIFYPVKIHTSLENSYKLLTAKEDLRIKQRKLRALET